jgi:hypothetical protein
MGEVAISIIVPLEMANDLGKKGKKRERESSIVVVELVTGKNLFAKETLPQRIKIK